MSWRPASRPSLADGDAPRAVNNGDVNLLLISREYPPFFGGGIGAYADRFTRTMAERSHRMVVVTVSGSGCEEREERHGVTVVRLPFLVGDRWDGPHPSIAMPGVRGAWRAFWGGSVLAMQIADALPRLCAEFSIDAIEAPDTGGLAWFALNRRRNDPAYAIPPVVTVVHSPTAWVEELNRSHAEGRAMVELRQMEGESVRWSDAVLCPSTDLARGAERLWYLPAGSIRTIPYALGDLEDRATRAVASPDQPAERSRVAFFGRLEYRKGVDTLLRAFARAARRRTDLVLDLVGADTGDPDRPGPLGQRLWHELVPEDLRPRVRLHGRLEPARVAAIRSAAGVVVVPSPTDNYPFTCIEAMADGKIVIASDSGGMREMIRGDRDGFLFAARDDGALEAAILGAVALTPAGAAAMRRAAAARILDLCGNDCIVRARVEHFRRVIADRRPAERCDPGGVAWIADGHLRDEDRRRLFDALRSPGVDFAHGWTLDASDDVSAYGTPTRETIAGAPPLTSALVVRRSCCTEALARDPAGVLRDLVRRGLRGAVVPEVVSRPTGIPGPRFLGRLGRLLGVSRVPG